MEHIELKPRLDCIVTLDTTDSAFSRGFPLGDPGADEVVFIAIFAGDLRVVKHCNPKRPFRSHSFGINLSLA